MNSVETASIELSDPMLRTKVLLCVLLVVLMVGSVEIIYWQHCQQLAIEDSVSASAMVNHLVHHLSPARQMQEPFREALTIAAKRPAHKQDPTSAGKNTHESSGSSRDQEGKLAGEDGRTATSGRRNRRRSSTVEANSGTARPTPEADQLLAKGQYDDAAAMYAETLSHRSKDVGLRIAAIAAYSRGKHYSEAQSLCREGITVASSPGERAIFENILQNQLSR